MVAMKDIIELSDQIAHEFHPERIILYGSHARGDATEDSDVDLMVILPFEGQSARMALEIRKRIRRDFPLDLLARTPQEVRQRIEDEDWFLREIIAQGKVLYEAAHE